MEAPQPRSFFTLNCFYRGLVGKGGEGRRRLVVGGGNGTYGCIGECGGVGKGLEDGEWR